MFLHLSLKGFLIKRVFLPPAPSREGDNTLKINRLSPFGGGWGEEKGKFNRLLFN